MSTILNLFEVARQQQLAVAAPTPASVKAGRSLEERNKTNSRYPEAPAKASYKERLAKINNQAQEKARVERLARIKAARLARREAAVALRKECLEILRFGGKVLFSLPFQVLRNAMAQAKQAGHVAFVRVVQEYALGCMEVGFEFDVQCESWIARQAHKAALAAERQAIKEALRESLREHFEEAGLVVYATRVQQVAQESIQTREVAAQSVKHAGKYAHLEAACPRIETEKQIIASVERAIKGIVAKEVAVVKVEVSYDQLLQSTEEANDYEGDEERELNTMERKMFSYSKQRRVAKQTLARLPDGKANDADAIRKEKAQAVVDYYSTLISTVRKALKGTMTEEQVTTANKEAAAKLATVTKACKVKLASFRKGRKAASSAKSESKKGKKTNK